MTMMTILHDEDDDSRQSYLALDVFRSGTMQIEKRWIVRDFLLFWRVPFALTFWLLLYDYDEDYDDNDDDDNDHNDTDDNSADKRWSLWVVCIKSGSGALL